MHRRTFLANAAVTSVVAALPIRAQAATTDRNTALRAMLDRFFYARLDTSPEQATRLGLDSGSR
jgi:uncharacterized protein (DUF885 family)